MSALINNAFDDIVFENRNKLFGAYTLRRFYDRYVLTAMAVSVTTFGVLVSLPVILNQFKDETIVVEKTHMVEVKLADIPPPVESTTPPPPPPPKIEAPKLSTVKFLPPVVKPDEEVVEEIPPTVEELAESNAGEVNQEGELTLDEIIVVDDVVEEIIEPEKEEIYTWVAEMPEFKGGDEALIRFLGDRMNYPKDAIKNNIEGDVWIEFIVNKDGHLSDFKVLRSLGHGCDEEALRVAKQMPAWKPAYQNGNPVMLKKKMRISFKFQN